MNSTTKKVFSVVFVTQLVDLLAFTLILPLLPKILDFYAKNDKSGWYSSLEENFSFFFARFVGSPNSQNQVLLAGLLGSWFSMLQFVSSPFVGALSDKFGRKPIMLLAMVGSLVSYVMWFLASESFGLFVLSRTLGGLSKSTVSLSLAIIADVSDDSSRGKGMALVGSSFSVAFIIGPSLGAYLSSLAIGNQLEAGLIRNPSSIAILLSILNLLLVYQKLSETNPALRKHYKSSKVAGIQTAPVSRALQYVNPRSLFGFDLVKFQSEEETHIVRAAGMIYFSYLLFYSGLEFTLSFLTHMRFGFSPAEQGKLYIFSGLLMVIIQGGFVRRLRPGREPTMSLIGLILIVPAFTLMGLSSSVNQVYCSLTLYSFSSAVVVPCLTTVVSSHSPHDARGVVMGTLRSLGALARAIGPCLSSFLFWTLGSTVCYLCGAVALLWPLYSMRGLYHNLNTLKSDGSPSLKKKSVAFREPAVKVD